MPKLGARRSAMGVVSIFETVGSPGWARKSRVQLPVVTCDHRLASLDPWGYPSVCRVGTRCISHVDRCPWEIHRSLSG
jgi:hypothetical protein